MKVYFFPGLGADASLAPLHPLPGHSVEWLEWPRESFRDWRGFLDALQARHSLAAGAVYVGISFGGMVAQAMAGRIRPKAILLIGSCRSSRAVNPWLRAIRPILGGLPAALFHPHLLPRPMAGFFFGIRKREHLDLLYAMGRRLGPAPIKRLNRLALGFEAPALEGIPVRSLHGAMDRMIRADAEHRDRILEDGGHLISMTHAETVNHQIVEWIAGLE